MADWWLAVAEDGSWLAEWLPEQEQKKGNAAILVREIEIAIKEGKTILRKGRISLRSKKPELVEQEFWGMVLAHYLVRRMMAEAALERKRDPDELSYESSIEIIKSTLSGPALSFSP